jgi:NYN domain
VYGCHVYNGKTVAEGGKALKQKGVDVLLAIHALGHVYRNNTKEVVLLTGDGNFTPLVRELVREGAYVTVWHEKKSTAADLVEAADFSKDLNALQALSATTESFRLKHPIPRMFKLEDDRTDSMRLVKEVGSGNGKLARGALCAGGTVTIRT